MACGIAIIWISPMHYEILVEDKSGEIMLNALMEKLKESGDTYRVHPYNGCGKIPKDLDKNPDPTLHFLWISCRQHCVHSAKRIRLMNLL